MQAGFFIGELNRMRKRRAVRDNVLFAVMGSKQSEWGNAKCPTRAATGKNSLVKLELLRASALFLTLNAER